MTLKKVKTGDRLRIDASTFNAFIDAAAAHQHSQRNIATPPRGKNDASKVLVRNSTGQDLPRFSVLGIDNVLIDPATQLDRFCAQVAFDGVVPTSDHLGGRIVITAEPIAAGKLGRAYASGCCPARIDRVSADDAYAKPIAGDATRLASATEGPLLILWAQSGLGDKWAIVRFGASGAAAEDTEDTVMMGLITSVPDYSGTSGYQVRVLPDYPAWETGTYPAGSIVQHGLSFHEASVETSAEPGTSGDWQDVTDTVAPETAIINPLGQSDKLLVDCIPWLRVGDTVPLIEVEDKLYIHLSFTHVGADAKSLMWNSAEQRAMAVWK